MHTKIVGKKLTMAIHTDRYYIIQGCVANIINANNYFEEHYPTFVISHDKIICSIFIANL